MQSSKSSSWLKWLDRSLSNREFSIDIVTICSRPYTSTQAPGNDDRAVRSDVRDDHEKFCTNSCCLFLCGGFETLPALISRMLQSPQ